MNIFSRLEVEVFNCNTQLGRSNVEVFNCNSLRGRSRPDID